MWTERLPDAAPFVFDEIDGRWVAVTTAPGKCNGAGTTEDVERWKMLALQQRPDGSLSGEYLWFDASGCNGKRAVTLSRVRDVTTEDGVADPSSLAPRVASPASALWGRYHYTTSGVTATKNEYDLGGLTACLRTGDRCMSFFRDPSGARQAMVFANGKWTYRNEWDDKCMSGGNAHAVETGEFPLPQRCRTRSRC